MKKQRTLGAVPVERSSGKRIPTWVYADSDGMLFKAQLAAKIAVLVHHRRLTQTHAEIPGLTQPKVCALLKGRSCCVSEHRLLKCLTRLWRDVHIVVKPTRRSGSSGRHTLGSIVTAQSMV